MQPDGVLRAAPDGHDPPRRLPDVAVTVDDMGATHRDAFEQGAIHVAPPMRQVQPIECALGQRIVQRCPLAREIGQHQQAVGAGGRSGGLFGEGGESRFRGKLARHLVAKPMGQRAACGQPRHRGMDPRKQPWRIPQPRVAHPIGCQRDHEDGRAIHHHHVTRMPHAHADGLGGGIDGAAGDGCASHKPGFGRRHLGHPASDLGRPHQARQPVGADDVVGQCRRPILGGHIIERAEIGGGVMIDHMRAGQTENHMAGRCQDLGGLCKDLGVMAFEPQDLWPDRLRGQRIAAAIKDRVGTDAARQFRDLGACAGVDAIEHPIHQRVARRIDGQHAGPDGAGGDAGDIARRHARRGQNGARDTHHIAPPVFVGAMFGPAGAWDQHLVGVAGLGKDPAVLVHKNALGFEGTDVDAKRAGHGVPSSRDSAKSGPMPASAHSSSRAKATRSSRSHISSAEWV